MKNDNELVETTSNLKGLRIENDIEMKTKINEITKPKKKKKGTFAFLIFVTEK